MAKPELEPNGSDLRPMPAPPHHSTLPVVSGEAGRPWGHLLNLWKVGSRCRRVTGIAEDKGRSRTLGQKRDKEQTQLREGPAVVRQQTGILILRLRSRMRRIRRETSTKAEQNQSKPTLLGCGRSETWLEL